MKFYVITRADLSPGQQLAQSVHAISDFAYHYPEAHKFWTESSNTVVCLSVADEASLLSLQDDLKAIQGDQLPVVGSWYEPDMNNAYTAIYALGEPEAIGFVTGKLSLALKEKRNEA